MKETDVRSYESGKYAKMMQLYGYVERNDAIPACTEHWSVQNVEEETTDAGYSANP